MSVAAEVYNSSIAEMRMLLPSASVYSFLSTSVSDNAFNADSKFSNGNPLSPMMMFIFDTLGVAAFTVDGVAVGKSSSFGGNWFLLVFLGVITGVGGGMIRDILASRVPEVLQKHVYALASIIGALITGIMTIYGIDEQISVICGFAAIVLLRILAARFRWNLPRVGKSSRNRKRSSKDIGIDDGDIQDDE